MPLKNELQPLPERKSPLGFFFTGKSTAALNTDKSSQALTLPIEIRRKSLTPTLSTLPQKIKQSPTFSTISSPDTVSVSEASDSTAPTQTNLSSPNIDEGSKTVWKIGGHLFYDGCFERNATIEDEGLDTSKEKVNEKEPESKIDLQKIMGSCYCCKRQLKGDDQLLQCSACKGVIHSSCSVLVDCLPCTQLFKEKKLQTAFLKFFTSILQNYRPYLIPASLEALNQDQGFTEFFRKADFVAASDKETKPFLLNFMETQAFSEFAIERIEKSESDHDILFFDESLKAKRNRSKFRINKEMTPFIEDSSYKISQTIQAIEPNSKNATEIDYKNIFPIKLNPEFMLQPRQVKPLITESDQKILNRHTHELIERSRATNVY